MSDPARRARVLSSRPIHDGRVVSLRLEEVELPGGRRSTLELIRHPGAAAILPLDADGDALLVRQYRHAAGGEWLLEVPAGKLDPGEDPETCARRECEEETGLRPGELVPLGSIWTTPGFTDERIWLFLARDLSPGRQDLQADEALSVERRPFPDVVRQALDGGIDDGKSVATILRAARYFGMLEPPPGASSASSSAPSG